MLESQAQILEVKGPGPVVWGERERDGEASQGAGPWQVGKGPQDHA